METSVVISLINNLGSPVAGALITGVTGYFMYTLQQNEKTRNRKLHCIKHGKLLERGSLFKKFNDQYYEVEINTMYLKKLENIKERLQNYIIFNGEILGTVDFDVWQKLIAPIDKMIENAEQHRQGFKIIIHSDHSTQAIDVANTISTPLGKEQEEAELVQHYRVFPTI